MENAISIKGKQYREYLKKFTKIYVIHYTLDYYGEDEECILGYFTDKDEAIKLAESLNSTPQEIGHHFYITDEPIYNKAKDYEEDRDFYKKLWEE